jgi:hypothetical protein
MGKKNYYEKLDTFWIINNGEGYWWWHLMEHSYNNFKKLGESLGNLVKIGGTLGNVPQKMKNLL